MVGAIVLFLILNLFTTGLLYIGYLLAYRGRRDLIAGYRESNFRYPEKYGRLVGFSIFVAAGMNFIMSILLVLNFSEPTYLDSYWWVIVIPPVLASIAGNIKYRQR